MRISKPSSEMTAGLYSFKHLIPDFRQRLLHPTAEDRERTRKATERQYKKNMQHLRQVEWHNQLRKFSGLSSEDIASQTLEGFDIHENDHTVYRLISEWTVEKPFGYALMGSYGSGKTRLVKGLMIRLASQKIRSLFLNVDDYLAMLRKPEANMDCEKIFKPRGTNDRPGTDNTSHQVGRQSRFSHDDLKMVVLDDLGFEKLTEFAQVELTQALNFLEHRAIRLFITTNLTTDELKARYDPRFIDRLRQMVVFQELSAKSYRSKIYRENQRAI